MESGTASNKRTKENLERNSQEHREAFETELSEAVGRAKRVATSALVIGGGFALSYLLIKKLSGGKKIKVKEKRHADNGTSNEVIIHKQPSVFSTVGNVVLTEIAVFLLAIGKEKLKNYIENINSGHDEHPKDA